MSTSARGPEPPPRERILAAAGELFGRSGVRAVGVDAIISTAQVAKASFYYHFPSKDDLVATWLRSDQARWVDRVRVYAERRADDAESRLVGFFDALADEIDRPDFPGCPYLNTAAELREAPSAIRTVVVDYLDEVQEYLHGLVGQAGLADADQLAAALRLLVAGAMSCSLGLGGSADPRPGLNAALALVAAAPPAPPQEPSGSTNQSV